LWWSPRVSNPAKDPHLGQRVYKTPLNTCSDDLNKLEDWVGFEPAYTWIATRALAFRVTGTCLQSPLPVQKSIQFIPKEPGKARASV